MPNVLSAAKNGGGDVWSALLANANRGGENVHTGAVLGALLGAEAGFSALAPELSAGLVNRVEIGAEIDAVVAALDQ